MKPIKRRFSPNVLRERLKQFIMANCRSLTPVRYVGMEKLATEVGVYTNPTTVEMDLVAYVNQINEPTIIKELFLWARQVAYEMVIPELPKGLPQFQLDLA